MHTRLLILVLTALAACSQQSPPPAASTTTAPPTSIDVPAGSYTVDKAHTSLLVRVNHMGFSHFTARFKRLDAQLQFDPAMLASSAVTVTIDARSLETDYPDLATLDFNAQLQGPEWLDAAQHPQITYRSTSVEAIDARRMKINGELTLRGVTHPVALDAVFNGGYAGHPMDPHARIGFSAHGTFRRSDFGMSYGIPEPGTTMGVFDEVEVIVETEFSGPAWAGAPAAQDGTS